MEEEAAGNSQSVWLLFSSPRFCLIRHLSRGPARHAALCGNSACHKYQDRLCFCLKRHVISSLLIRATAPQRFAIGTAAHKGTGRWHCPRGSRCHAGFSTGWLLTRSGICWAGFAFHSSLHRTWQFFTLTPEEGDQHTRGPAPALAAGVLSSP